MAWMLVCLIVLNILRFTSSLTCMTCKPENCLLINTCTGNKVKDNCGCCDVCAKVAFEDCGGHYGTHGKCDRGLECVKPKRTYPPVFSMSTGTCVKILEEDQVKEKNENQEELHRITRRDTIQKLSTRRRIEDLDFRQKRKSKVHQTNIRKKELKLYFDHVMKKSVYRKILLILYNQFTNAITQIT